MSQKKPSSPERGSPAPRKTILVVDDDESIRTFVSMTLNETYAVIVADSGEDALRKSREFEGTIHLMLSNVQMPRMNGLELGTKISAERPDMRVMLMSGYASGMLVLNEGWHFLHKPFIPSQLRDLVSSLLMQPSATSKPDINEHRD